MSMRRQHELLLDSTIVYCIYLNALKAMLCSYVILILICIQILIAHNDETVYMICMISYKDGGIPALLV